MTIEYESLNNKDKELINKLIISTHARSLILEDYCSYLRLNFPDKKDIIRVETKKIADEMHKDFKKLRRQFGGIDRVGQFSSFDDRATALQQETNVLFEEKKKILLDNLGIEVKIE